MSENNQSEFVQSAGWGLGQVKGLRNLYLSSNDGENILENGEMKVGIVCISLEQ